MPRQDQLSFAWRRQTHRLTLTLILSWLPRGTEAGRTALSHGRGRVLYSTAAGVVATSSANSSHPATATPKGGAR